MKIRSASLLTVLAATLASAHLASAAILVVNVSDNSTIRESINNSGNSSILFVGDTTTATDYLRSAVAFDLTNPALVGATINSVTLAFTARVSDASSANADLTVNIHQLSSSFTNGDGTVNSGVTWTSRNGTNNWTAPGGDFGGILASATANPSTIGGGNAVNFSGASLASATQSAVGGTFYLLAKSAAEDNTARNLFQFASSRNTTGTPTAYPGPVLTIDYTVIPEPSTALLSAFGMLALLRRRR